MGLEESVLLQEFMSETDARIVASYLESQNIECHIQTDNVAGLHPELSLSSGVKLFVKQDSFEIARKLIQATNLDQSEDNYLMDDEHDSQPQNTNARGISISSLLLGVLLGLVVGFFCFKSYYKETYSSDINNDGNVDNEHVYIGDFLAEASYDSNFDEKFDVFYQYKNDGTGRGSRDANYDGVTESWWNLVHDHVVFESQDRDKDGVPDIFYYYNDNFLSKIELRPKDSKTVVTKTIINRDFSSDTYFDDDRDGEFDRVEHYDKFELLMGSENLKK